MLHRKSTYQTFTRLALIYPLLPTLKHYIFQFLMLARLKRNEIFACHTRYHFRLLLDFKIYPFRITLRTAHISSAAALPCRAIAWLVFARNYTFPTRTYLTRLITRKNSIAVFDFGIFKHTTYKTNKRCS